MFSFEKDGDMVSQILKQLAKLEDATVQVGHFEDQGNHSTAVKPNGTPYSYVELMYYHHTGDASTRPPRQPLSVLKIQNRNLSQHGWMKSAVRLAVSEIDNDLSKEKALKRVANNLVKLEKAIFGDPILLAGTANNTDPLIDTGELRSKVTSKIDTGGVVKNAT
jgi:hypothetical protein